MTLNCKLILFGTSWVIDRLPSIEEFWGDKVLFDWTVVHADQRAVEMQRWGSNAVMDDAVVGRWADDRFDLTILCSPWFLEPKDYSGTILENRATVNGLYLPHKNTIEVFANEHDSSFVGQKPMGDTFSLFLNHELSHHFYQSVLKEVDMTHQLFYAGTPEVARDYILSKI